jgi:nucleotide-binding universal stress UspA family protein
MTARETRPGPILVGVERSGPSRDALAVARRLARASGARLLLVSIYPIGARSATIEQSAYARGLADEAEAALDWVAGGGGGARPPARAAPLCGARPEARAVPSTSIPRGLQQIAVTEGALAIVVGPSHRGPLGRMVQGSVGERLLRGAPCPIVVATGGSSKDAHAAITRIGVGYVATPEGIAALHAAAGLAARSGAGVRALSVVEPPPVSAALPFGWRTGVLESTARDELASRILRATEGAAAPVKIVGEVVDGYADDELVQLSREVDLLVCGSSGRRPVGGIMAGSASAGTLRKACCPLLLVPRGARDGFANLGGPAALVA